MAILKQVSDTDVTDVNSLNYGVDASEKSHSPSSDIFYVCMSQKEIDDWISLMLASQKRHVETVRLLLEDGAMESKLYYFNGNTALVITAQNGFIEITKLILQYSNVKNRNAHGYIMALFLAAQNGHLETVNMLLCNDFSKDIYTSNITSYSLIFALTNGHNDIAALLIEKGSAIVSKIEDLLEISQAISKHEDYFIKENGEYIYAFDIAREKGLTTGYFCKETLTALAIASHKGNTTMIKTLIGYGAYMEEEDERGYTPLMIAVENEHVDAVEVLLDLGADVNHVGKHRHTALLEAACHSGTQILELLLKHKADIHAASEDKLTALMFATHHGHRDSVDVLLRLGADVNVHQAEKWTTLMIASFRGHFEIVEKLIEYNSDVNQVQGERWSSLMLASKNGHFAVAELLLKHRAKVDQEQMDKWTTLLIASSANYSDLVELLIRNEANLDHRSTEGWTALMLAASEGHLATVECLMKEHTQLNMCNKDGEDAVMLASKYGHEKIVSYLLQCGAEVNSSNKKGETALMLATSNGHEEIVELLCQNNVDVNYRSTRPSPQSFWKFYPYKPVVSCKQYYAQDDAIALSPIHVHFHQPIRNVTIKESRQCSLENVANVAMGGSVITHCIAMRQQSEALE